MKRILISILKFIAFFLGWAVLASLLPLPPTESAVAWRFWAELIPLLVTVVLTLIFWLLEKKSVELHLLGYPYKGVIYGIITGIIWLAVPVFAMYALGSMRIDGVNSISLFPIWILSAFLNVVMQELLVRGYLYQMLKQKHNTVAAVIVTTMLFTALHGGVFEAGIIPVLNVLTMSLLMTVVLEYTGSIIAPIIMHFIWNAVGSLVLGGVSLADDYPKLLVASFTGNKIISGGDCKIEGSIIVLFVNLILIAIFVALETKRKSKR